MMKSIIGSKMCDELFFIGLGNQGHKKDLVKTRLNAGLMFLDYLADEWDLKWTTVRPGKSRSF